MPGPKPRLTVPISVILLPPGTLAPLTGPCFCPVPHHGPSWGGGAPQLAYTLGLPGPEGSVSERQGRAQRLCLLPANVPGALFFVLLLGHLFL